jgi:hypothetical protein
MVVRKSFPSLRDSAQVGSVLKALCALSCPAKSTEASMSSCSDMPMAKESARGRLGVSNVSTSIEHYHQNGLPNIFVVAVGWVMRIWIGPAASGRL